jgi:hypothetical protein
MKSILGKISWRFGKRCETLREEFHFMRISPPATIDSGVKPSEGARDVAMTILAHQEAWLKGRNFYTIDDAATLIESYAKAHDDAIRREGREHYESILDKIARMHETSNSEYAAYRMRKLARESILGTGPALGKSCETCKYDGSQMSFRSGCTGCGSFDEYKNYEPAQEEL